VLPFLFKTKVVADFALDIRTTNMKTELPSLSEEAAIALLAAEGNFKSILTDLLERRNNTSAKIDSLYQSIVQRRKYTSFISQLSAKAVNRERIVTTETDSNYASLLSGLFVDESQINSLKSSHSLLDDLSEDSHPQYLMKSGGAIVGDITIENDVWIGAKSTIMSGVKIGNGAVIGATTTVTKDVPPYAIVVGNPGKVVKYRFTEKQIDLLLQISWWNWDEEKIKRELLGLKLL
jgi:hypothetical protein